MHLNAIPTPPALPVLPMPRVGLVLRPCVDPRVTLNKREGNTLTPWSCELVPREIKEH